jgi:hypothetical protein
MKSTYIIFIIFIKQVGSFSCSIISIVYKSPMMLLIYNKKNTILEIERPILTPNSKRPFSMNISIINIKINTTNAVMKSKICIYIYMTFLLGIRTKR